MTISTKDELRKNLPQPQERSWTRCSSIEQESSCSVQPEQQQPKTHTKYCSYFYRKQIKEVKSFRFDNIFLMTHKGQVLLKCVDVWKKILRHDILFKISLVYCSI